MFTEQFIIQWSNRFPKDRVYRKKYNIAFGSKQHRDTNQIDIYLDIVEDIIFDKYINQYKQENESLETYRNEGKWLKESELGEKEFDKIFDSVDISKLNKKDG